VSYEKLSRDILDLIGGTENVNSVVHCVTRLRFKLKDESVAKTEELKKLDGVVTVMKSVGQYQVVIGNHVPDVYATVLKVGNISGVSENNDSSSDKKTWLGCRIH
jgi:PTS system beta-glucosides-specific IIC component